VPELQHSARWNLLQFFSAIAADDRQLWGRLIAYN